MSSKRQFASDIQQLRDVQSELQASHVQTEQLVARLAHVTVEGFKDVNAKISSLVDSQIRTDHVTLEGFKDVNAKINSLVDLQIRTDENLRKLIAVVDRYFSDGRNGG